MYTSKPPAMPPNVGNAGFGTAASTTRGVEPLQLGAVQVAMLWPNAVYRPGTGVRPLLPPKLMTGTLMFGACVRFAMSGRVADSADESRLIDCEQSPLVAHVPAFPTVQFPAVQIPLTLV